MMTQSREMNEMENRVKRHYFHFGQDIVARDIVSRNRVRCVRLARHLAWVNVFSYFRFLCVCLLRVAASFSFSKLVMFAQRFFFITIHFILFFGMGICLMSAISCIRITIINARCRRINKICK